MFKIVNLFSALCKAIPVTRLSAPYRAKTGAYSNFHIEMKE